MRNEASTPAKTDEFRIYEAPKSVFLVIVKTMSGKIRTEHALKLEDAKQISQWWKKQKYCASADVVRYRVAGGVVDSIQADSSR